MFGLFQKKSSSITDFDAACQAVKIVTGVFTDEDFNRIRSTMKLMFPNGDLKAKSADDVSSVFTEKPVCKETFVSATISTIIARKDVFRKSQYNELVNLANQCSIPVYKIDVAVRQEVSKLPKSERKFVYGF